MAALPTWVGRYFIDPERRVLSTLRGSAVNLHGAHFSLRRDHQVPVYYPAWPSPVTADPRTTQAGNAGSSATVFALALTATACGGGDGDNESSGGGKDKI
ncbi:hypothetical protein ABZ044_34775, partial [Streptomyces werraensis]